MFSSLAERKGGGREGERMKEKEFNNTPSASGK